MRNCTAASMLSSCLQMGLILTYHVQQVNCCTQLWFEEGLERAKELDAIFARTKKPIGPYHGLPFSIKDQFNMKGKITSAGFLAWVDNLCSEDSPTVRILREAGAVFYCKTNNPQTVMHLETNSNGM
jgi:amidase